MSENSIIVPFGKYKGQPLEIMLSDANYVNYQKQQPGFMKWLQDNHITIYNIFTTGAQQIQDTPEHNKLQARFLDKNFQLAFLDAVVGLNVHNIFKKKITIHREKIIEKQLELEKLPNDLTIATNTYEEERVSTIARLQKWIDGNPTSYEIETKKRRIEKLNRHEIDSDLRWDYKNLARKFDVTKEIKDKIADCKSSIKYYEKEVSEYQLLVDDPCTLRTNIDFENGYDVNLEIKNENFIHHGSYLQFRIEVKPSVGDDYPAVLRQVKINQPLTTIIKHQGSYRTYEEKKYFYGIDVLLIGKFESESINIDQLRGIFWQIQNRSAFKNRRKFTIEARYDFRTQASARYIRNRIAIPIPY
jgi:hypothetical protein